MELNCGLGETAREAAQTRAVACFEMFHRWRELSASAGLEGELPIDEAIADDAHSPAVHLRFHSWL